MTLKDTFEKLGEEIHNFVHPHNDRIVIKPHDTIQDTITEIARLVKDPKGQIKYEELPKFDELVHDWFGWKKDVSHDEFFRRLLNVYRESIHSKHYDDALGKLPDDQRDAVEAFVAGHHDAHGCAHNLIARHTQAHTQSHTHLVHTEPEPRAVHATDLEFQNWGRTVKNTPKHTFYPTTVKEIQTIIRDATKNNMGVRAAGFRHSWAPLFGRDQKVGEKNNGDVLISMLTESNAGKLPNFTSLPGNLFQPKPTELNSIEIVEASTVHGPALKGGKQYVRMGTSTTLEQFRRWAIGTGHVTLPMNIIEVEITIGGSNAPICHGAGIKNPTISDLVRRVEYVDVHGELHNVDMRDPHLLKAVGGCFGLIGYITHITFECIPMVAAVMAPQKLDVIDAVPPPPGMKECDIPEVLRLKRTEKERRHWQAEFERRANNDFYAEWFWLPYSNKVWVNTWDTSTDLTDVVNYPSTGKTFFQVLGTVAMNITQNVFSAIHLMKVCPEAQTRVFSWLAMKNFDEATPEKPIKCLLPNALHFQRGVQNIRVRDMEVEMPILPKKGTTNVRDFTNIQQAWWDAIILCYANKETAPQRMPLEMRIMAGSEMTMAPQRGHKLGTCAIEILTLHACANIWNPYAQAVLDKWMNLKDNEGRPLKETMRPHWAKEWDQFTVDGQRWREKLKNQVYKDQIVEFKGLLAEVGQKHGWTLAEIKKTFSNDLLDFMYFDDVDVITEVKPAVTQTVILPKKTPIVASQEIIDHADLTA